MYDVIVIGLGVYGLSLSRACAGLGLRTLGIEQFAFGHDKGSSHGESRIVRFTTLEGKDYAALTRRADQLWRELERNTERQLIHRTGLALIAEPASFRQRHHGREDILARAKWLADEEGIAYRTARGRELKQEYPDIVCSDQAKVFLEKDAYVLAADQALAALSTTGLAAGAEHLYCTRVSALDYTTRDYCSVQTETGLRLKSRSIVIAAGPYIRELVDVPANSELSIRPQSLAWYTTRDDRPLQILPFVLTQPQQPLFFAMAEDWLGAKKTRYKVVAENEYASVASARKPFRRLTRELHTATSELALGALPRLNARPMRRQTCYYTTAPDSRLRERMLNAAGTAVQVSACSGHGFKFAPAIADSLAQRLHHNLRG